MINRNKVYESPNELDKDTLEKLKYGLYLFSSSGLKVSDGIKAGEDVSIYCLAKVNKRSTCLAFGSCPNMKFEWNFPLSLSDSIKSTSSVSKSVERMSASSRLAPTRDLAQSNQNNLRDVRIFIDDDPVINLHSPDDEVHLSTLTIESIGSIHDGKWLCNFKYFDEINEKMDRNFMQFQLNVETRDEDQVCEHSDHCSSGNCLGKKCACSVDYPIYDPQSGDCFVPSTLGAECEIDAQCSEGSYCGIDPNCAGANTGYRVSPRFSTPKSADQETADRENQDKKEIHMKKKYTSYESRCSKICLCREKLIPVSLAFNQTKCYTSSVMKSPCESTDQCELSDPNTYCGFNQVCECKEGKRCREPIPIICGSDDDCTLDQYCRYERCVARKKVGTSCSSNEECQKSDSNTICSNGKCRCGEAYKPAASGGSFFNHPLRGTNGSRNQRTNRTCIKEESCNSHSDCFDDHYCRKSTGTCVEGLQLGSSCRSLIECKARDKNSICSYDTPENGGPLSGGLNPDYFWGSPTRLFETPEILGICACRPRFSPSSSVPSVCIADGYCINDNDCPTDSHCVEGKCFDEVGSSCRTSERCIQLMKYSYCDRVSKKCECDSNYEFDTLNGTCEPKECMTRIDCKKKDCINNYCSCPSDKNTNDYGYCVEKREEKDPGDEDMSEYSFLDDLKRIFTDWTWEAYVIIVGISIIVLLAIIIVIILIRIIRLRRQIIEEREKSGPTADPLTSDAVTDYID